MLILDKLADDRLREAFDRGEFENLPGQGKPLALDDLSHIPEETRMAYKIMKNAEVIPPGLELRKEIDQLQQTLINDKDKRSRTKTLKKMQYLYIKLDMSNQRYSNLALQQVYYEKLLNQLTQVP
jgi:hypothetical protein